MFSHIPTLGYMDQFQHFKLISNTYGEIDLKNHNPKGNCIYKNLVKIYEKVYNTCFFHQISISEHHLCLDTKATEVSIIQFLLSILSMWGEG